MLAGGQAEQPLSPTNLGHTSVLHAACRVSEGQRSAVDAARGGGRVFYTVPELRGRVLSMWINALDQEGTKAGSHSKLRTALGKHTPALALPVPPQAGDVAVAELLLQAGANLDAVEVMRRTPLM